MTSLYVVVTGEEIGDQLPPPLTERKIELPLPTAIPFVGVENQTPAKETAPSMITGAFHVRPTELEVIDTPFVPTATAAAPAEPGARTARTVTRARARAKVARRPVANAAGTRRRGRSEGVGRMGAPDRHNGSR